MANKVECDNCRVDGEGRLSAHLHDEFGDRAIVLDDRKLPGTSGNIDHIVVASSGVWVIDAKEYDGRVERRDVGGLFKVDQRLYVAGRERTNLVDRLEQQLTAVEDVLATEGLDRVPVHAALCFVSSEWGWFAKPFTLNAVWVTWPQKLTELVFEWNAAAVPDLDRLALTIGAALPASS